MQDQHISLMLCDCEINDPNFTRKQDMEKNRQSHTCLTYIYTSSQRISSVSNCSHHSCKMHIVGEAVFLFLKKSSYMNTIKQCWHWLVSLKQICLLFSQDSTRVFVICVTNATSVSLLFLTNVLQKYQLSKMLCMYLYPTSCCVFCYKVIFWSYIFFYT